MRKRVAGVALVVALAIAAASTIVAAAKDYPIDFTDTYTCAGGEALDVHIYGWVDGKEQFGDGFRYHLRHVYTNANGRKWQYSDTGIVKGPDVEQNFTLSGRSVGLFNEPHGRIGHIVVEAGQITKHAGRDVGGPIGDEACERLTS